MKEIMLFAFALIFLTGCQGQKLVEGDNLVARDGLRYEVNSDEPFTGISISYWPSGKKQVQEEYHDGKRHGSLYTWYENGQQERQIDYYEGKEHGKWLIWYWSGPKKVDGEYRDGTAYGKWILWHENGQKKAECEYRDGNKINEKRWTNDGHKVVEKNTLVERDGLWYEINSDEPFTGGWISSGNKRAEGEFLAGEKHGIWTEWNEYGGTAKETEYRNGEMISEKKWDNAGNLIK